MLNLTGEAEAYFRTLPWAVCAALERSNLTFRTVEDIKSYQADNLAHLNDVLYQELPEPAIPSNAGLDPLDTQNPF